MSFNNSSWNFVSITKKNAALTKKILFHSNSEWRKSRKVKPSRTWDITMLWISIPFFRLIKLRSSVCLVSKIREGENFYCLVRNGPIFQTNLNLDLAFFASFFTKQDLFLHFEPRAMYVDFTLTLHSKRTFNCHFGARECFKNCLST